MKVVIDTNVLVSAVLKDRDPEKVVLYIASQPDFDWIVSPQILKEYKDVLARDVFGLPADVLQTWFSLLDTMTVMIDADLDDNSLRIAVRRNNYEITADGLLS